MQLTGQTVLITGGTSGIGRSLAEALHARGNRVIVAGRRRALLDEIAAAHPGIVGLPLDVADPAAIEAFAADVLARFPDLDVLVNNAGISRAEDYAADAVDVETPAAIIQTNVTSVIQLTGALLPALRRRPRATIMTTTSGLAFLPRADYPTYCASKAFLHSWLESLRHQLRHTGVEVLELIPPYVQTELTGPAQAEDPFAMPLAAYLDEVMALLEGPGTEILVERAKELRFAERNGVYDAVFARRNPG